jgi:hypothetical protein
MTVLLGFDCDMGVANLSFLYPVSLRSSWVLRRLATLCSATQGCSIRVSCMDGGSRFMTVMTAFGWTIPFSYCPSLIRRLPCVAMHAR